MQVSPLTERTLWTAPNPYHIHGERDTYVPYSQAVRFHEALTKVGVKNQLLTIHDKGHGDFNSAENLRVWMTIQDFLQSVGSRHRRSKNGYSGSFMPLLRLNPEGNDLKWLDVKTETMGRHG